jgi:hypothetical protein
VLLEGRALVWCERVSQITVRDIPFDGVLVFHRSLRLPRYSKCQSAARHLRCSGFDALRSSRFIQRAITRPGPEEHSVEVERAQAEILANPGFGLRGHVVTKKNLAVSVGAEIREDLARDFRPLVGKEMARARR